MALLNAKLYVKRNGEAAVPCNLYSTTEEVGGEYVTVTASNTKAYAKLGGTSDAFCTQGRVKKGTNTYAILSQAKPPYNKIEYRTPGTYTVTFPAGVTTAKITVAGAGGGGGGGNVRYDDSGESYYRGGTGGQGALVTKSIAVTSGNTLQVVVGKGGAGGRTSPYNSNIIATGGSAGGTSSVLGVSAIGGGGGAKGNFGPGANGTSYGNGGAGGAGGYKNTNGSNGNDGWVIIEYGGDI